MTDRKIVFLQARNFNEVTVKAKDWFQVWINTVQINIGVKANIPNEFISNCPKRALKLKGYFLKRK